ncbi:MAG: UDP-3-O-acyl-N-acetylglucosamine deacetylase [bacterium]|nr:UDP-3-O-acyl-N-acetylglucosamine deacetylase [bacterium]
MRYQRTIASPITCAGIGLHSGLKVKMAILPAPEDTGVVFCRVDRKNRLEIKAAAENVVDTSLNTTLGKGKVLVRTAEHLLSALAGLGIDNVIIELDGPEVPIMDGSAASYIYLLTSAGIRRQGKLQRFIKILEPIEVKEEDRVAALYPSDTPEITCEIDFDHPLLKTQRYHYQASENAFVRDIARARTFGFLKEVEYLQSKGFARGGSLDNAIVIGDYRILNSDGLRFTDEFVRHKILDAIGDLSLVGLPVIGHMLSVKSGHAMNAKLVETVLAHPEKWTYVTHPQDVRPAVPATKQEGAAPRYARVSA